MNITYKVIGSPVGKLILIAKNNKLTGLLWEKTFAKMKINAVLDDNNAIFIEAEKQLNEYFSGKRKVFDLPLEFIGTDFQKKVWQALLTIPHGKKLSYSELAAKIGSPKACRAVGLANSRNPISIVVPCHRVIGKNGRLTGFAGGLEVKDFLLNLEKKWS